MSTWGPWFITENEAYLEHENGYGFELTRFETPGQLRFWTDHISGKGWGTGRVIAALVAAYQDINWNRS